MPSLEDFVTARAMAMSPQYAEYMMRDRGSDPRTVAQAYAGVEEFLKRKQIADKVDFEQKAAMNFQVPQSLESMPQYQAPSPLELWGQKLSAMMQTGNPVLQKQAMSEMQAMNKQSTEIQKQDLSNAAKMARDMGLTPGSEEYVDFIREYAMKAGQTSIDLGNKYLTASDYKNLRDSSGRPIPNAPAGMTWDDVKAKGYTFGNIATEGEAAAEGSMAASQDMLKRLEHLTNNGADVTGIKGLIDDFRAGSGLTNATVDSLFTIFGKPKRPEDVEAHSISVALGNQLLQAFRGASVGPEEKEDFIKQLPTPGQPRDVFERNIQLTKKNLEIIMSKKRESRGYTTTGKTDIRTWTDGGYEYRMLPDGRTQRRKL